MTDLISRADAIGAVQDHFNDDGFKGYDDGQKMMDRITALPSADAIDGDLISRKVLMDRLESFCKWCKDGRLQGAEFVWDCIVPNVPSADAVPQLKQTDALIIADALRYLAKATERHLADRTRADALREQILQYGANMRSKCEVDAKWIPVSERLPKKGEVVLITNGKGNVRCGQYRSEYDVRDETHYWWWKGKTVESVLAWMPLPKPYRKDGEE